MALILALTFLYIYRTGKQKFVFLWFLAQFIYFLRLTILNIQFFLHNSINFAGIFASLLIPVSAFLFVSGTMLFMGKKTGFPGLILASLAIVWILLCLILPVELFWFQLPLYILPGLAQMVTGFALIRKRDLPVYESRISAMLFFLWGTLFFAFPYLNDLGKFRAELFYLEALVGFSLSLSIVLLNFRRNWDEQQLVLQSLKEFGNVMSRRVEIEVKKRRKQQDLLEQQARQLSMNQLMRNVSHHWRQPLSGLDLLLQDIQDARDMGELTDQYLDDSIAKGMETIRYMSRILDLFQSSVSLSEVWEEFDAMEMLLQTVSLFVPLLKEHGVGVECICPFKRCTGETVGLSCDMLSRHVPVRAIKHEFRQCILSVLNNAIESILKKTEDRRIQFTIGSENGMGVLQISDNGPGIDPQYREHIFEPYFTTDLDHQGLGLYATKLMLEKMGGNIRLVESDDSETRFEIRFPLATMEDGKGGEKSNRTELRQDQEGPDGLLD